MKRLGFLAITIIVLSLLISGCGNGSTNPPAKTKYIWKWGGSGVSSSALKSASFRVSDVSNYIANQPIEGFWDLDNPQSNQSNSIVYVATQENPNVAVTVNYTCDGGCFMIPGPSNTTYSSLNNVQDVTYRSTQAGIFHITATVVADNTVIDIPVHIYNALVFPINTAAAWGVNFDNNTWSNTINLNMSLYVNSNSTIIHTPSGNELYAQSSSESDLLFSLVTQAPQDLQYSNTTINATNPNLFASVYIAKTNSGKFVKMRFLSGGVGSANLFMFLASDSSGSFAD